MKTQAPGARSSSVPNRRGSRELALPRPLGQKPTAAQLQTSPPRRAEPGGAGSNGLALGVADISGQKTPRNSPGPDSALACYFTRSLSPLNVSLKQHFTASSTVFSCQNAHSLAVELRTWRRNPSPRPATRRSRPPARRLLPWQQRTSGAPLSGGSEARQGREARRGLSRLGKKRMAEHG